MLREDRASRRLAVPQGAAAETSPYNQRRPDRTEEHRGDHDRSTDSARPARLPRVDALLDDEERAIRDTVRRFVRERVLPEVGDWFEQGVLPREVIGELAKLGLFGMHLDGYGLPGASAVAYGLTCTELEAGDSGIRSAVSVQGSLAMFAIWRWGSEEQKEQLAAARCTRGEVIGCFGLTEPDAGSDPGGDAHARPARRLDWILNGTKMWITNGTIADIAVVWARTDDGEIRGFIVEKGMRGFCAPEIHKKISLRASVTSELVLEDVRVPGREPCCPARRRSAGRSRASTRRATGSSGAPSAPRGPASRRRSTTRRSGSSSEADLRVPADASRSSRRWRSRSTAARSSRSTSAG